MNIVSGVFQSVDQVVSAVTELHHAGITDDKIGVVTQDDSKRQMLGSRLDRDYQKRYTPGENVVYMPGVILDSMPEGYLRALRAQRDGDTAARWYRDQLGSGNILLTVVTEHPEETWRTMQSAGALPPTWMATTTELTTVTRPMETPTAAEVTIPIMEEHIRVEKVSEKVGEVIVTPQTTRRAVDIPATIEHQEVRVERRKLERPVSPDEYQMATTEEGVIRLPVIEEEVRVTKVPVVREELIITRIKREEQQTLHEEVTHTEPRVETSGDVNVTSEGEVKRRRPAA